MTRAGLLLLLTVALACSEGPEVRFEVPEWSGAWYKGNTHAHTTESDGDSSPEYVARWYKDHGYDFLVLTDHNALTDPAALQHLVDSTYLLIAGEEVTTSFEDAAVHVNGLNIPGIIEARTADWSGHPLVHNEGGGGTPGLEGIWDDLLTAGKRIYGIAVDDAHHFQGEFSADRVNPGRGWIETRAPALDAAALMEALEAGHFYASTGVEVDDVVVTEDRLEARIRERGDYRYSVEFFGPEGASLASGASNPAVYELAGDEAYVRAKMTDSGGSVAWNQSLFTVPR